MLRADRRTAKCKTKTFQTLYEHVQLRISLWRCIHGRWMPHFQQQAQSACIIPSPLSRTLASSPLHSVCARQDKAHSGHLTVHLIVTVESLRIRERCEGHCLHILQGEQSASSAHTLMPCVFAYQIDSAACERTPGCSAARAFSIKARSSTRALTSGSSRLWRVSRHVRQQNHYSKRGPTAISLVFVIEAESSKARASKSASMRSWKRMWRRCMMRQQCYSSRHDRGADATSELPEQQDKQSSEARASLSMCDRNTG